MRWHCMCFKQKMFFAMKNLNNEIYTGKLHKRRHLVSCLSFYFFIQPRFFHLYSGFISSPLPPPPPDFFSPLIKPIHSFPLFLFILLCYPYFVVCCCCCFVSLILQISSCHIAMVSHLLLLAALMSQFSKLRLFFSSSFDLEKVFLYFDIEKCMVFDCLFVLFNFIDK